MALPAGTHLGSYEVLALLGAGGMGEVYRARDPKLGREVAVKVLPPAFAEDPERLRRFEREARAAGSLNHPNILVVYGFGTHDGAPYLVMELLEGSTLRQRMGGRPMPVRKVADLGLQMAQGLAAAHEKGILHRDLKPENLFITREGRVKLLDFGLAKSRGIAEAEATTLAMAPEVGPVTQGGMVVGTVGYMSPEQVRGEPLDPRSDLFSLGVVLWEVATGVLPFQGATAVEVMSAILTRDPPDLDPALGISADLARILDSCLAKDPSERFHSAHDLAFALQSLRESPSGGGWTMGDLRPRSRRGWVALLLGLAAGGIGLASLLAGRGILLLLGSRQARRMPSLLALPARVLGPQEAGFLTDAVPDTLSTLLGGVAGLEMKLPPSSLQMENLQGDPARIAQASQVEFLVLSTVMVQEDHLELNVKLAEAGSRKVRWAAQFQGPRAAYNDLLRQAAGGVAQALGTHGGPLVPLSGNSEYELAMGEGKHFLYRFRNLGREGDFMAAMRAHERAMALDPSQSLPLARISNLHFFRGIRSGDSTAPAQAQAWAERALRQDPHCGEAWATLALLDAFRSPMDLERALDEALRAIRDAPHAPSGHMALSVIASSPGSMGIFLAASRQALVVEPMHVLAASHSSGALTALGRPGEALSFVDRALAIEPGNRMNQWTRAWALIRLGRLEEAAALLDAWPPTGGGWEPEWARQVGFARMAAGRDPAATVALGRELTRRYLDPVQPPQVVANAVLIMAPPLARCGMEDEALALMERAVACRVAPTLDQLLLDPDFRRLRGNPRFQNVLKASRDGAAVVVGTCDAFRSRGELAGYLDQPLADLRALVAQVP